MDIKHTRGDTFIKNFKFEDWDWVAINITWYTIVFTVRKLIDDTESLVQQNCTITSAVWWLAKITVTWTTMELDIWNYYYDFQMTTNASRILTFMKWI